MGRKLASRVMLIGWDGADWQMIRPLVEQGKMPNLAALMQRGVTGNLATIQPVLSPMLWNSIATGKRADKHGICGFLEPMPDRSGVRPVSSTSRKCKALWNILTQAGMTSQVISWFASHPAEPIRGSIVTDRYVAQCTSKEEDLSFPKGCFHPYDLEEKLSQLLVRPQDLEPDALLPFIPQASRIDQETDSRLFKLGSLLSRTSSVHAATMNLLSNKDWDLTAAYYIAIDEFGHTFMPYHPPRLEGVSDTDAEIFGEVMEGCYRFHDMMLGATVAKAPKDTTFVLVSDHGFKSDNQRPGPKGYENPVDWHRQFGVACLAGPGIREGSTLYGATVLDVTPTILSLLGLPTGADMDGRPWLEIFDAPVKSLQIPSWEDRPGDSGMHPSDLQEDAACSAEAIRQLVELGYIEAPSDDAEKSVKRVLKDQRANLAVAMASSRRAADSLPIWEELTNEYPEEHAYALQLASCLCHNLRFDDAVDVLEALPESLQDSFEVLLQRARIVQHTTQEESRVIELARAAREVAPDDPPCLNTIGSLFLDAGLLEEAERVFRQSLELLDENPAAHAGLAQLLVERGSFQAAAESAIDAVSLAHYYPKAHYLLGAALQGLKKNEEAIAALQTCLLQGFNTSDVHARIASLLRFSDPDRARLHAKQAESA